MPCKCFVPGCKTGYDLTIRENAKSGIRNPNIFSAPKDKELLEEWDRMILRKDRKLTIKDKVCELHFEEECLQRNFYLLNPDGSLYTYPKKRCVLKKGSIPTIFPNLPTYVALQKTKRKNSKPYCSSKSELNIFDNDLEISDSISQQSNEFLELSVEAKNVSTPNCSSEDELEIFDNDVNTDDFIPEEQNDFLKLSDEAKNVSTSNCSSEYEFNLFDVNLEVDDFISQEQNDFLKLSVEAKNISTPNPLWTDASIENCIIFVKWNTKYFPERRVVVCKDLSTKVFLMNVEVSLPVESCTVENIAQLLQKVDDFRICSNADSGTSSGCLGIIEDEMQEFCSSCCKSKENEKEAERIGSAQPVVSKKKKTTNPHIIVTKRQVLDLESKVKLPKYTYSRIRRNPS